MSRAAGVAVPRAGDAVLLTGATGFVGMAVLARLLEETDRDAVLLVRRLRVAGGCSVGRVAGFGVGRSRAVSGAG